MDKPKKSLFKGTGYGYKYNPNETSSNTKNIAGTVALNKAIKKEFKKSNKQLEIEAEEFELENIHKELEKQEELKQIEAELAEEERLQKEQEKYQPKDEVENEIAVTKPEEYKGFKDVQSKYDKLSAKTYSGIQQELFNRGQKQNSGFKSEENDSWLTSAGKNIANGLATLMDFSGSHIGATISQFQDKNEFTDKEEKEYEQLQKEVAKYRNPILERKKQGLVQKKNELEQIFKNKIKEGNISSDEIKNLQMSIFNYEDAIDLHQDAIDNGGFVSGLTNDLAGTLTLNMSNLKYNRQAQNLAEKQKDGEELTGVEKEFMDSYNTLQTSKYSGLNKNMSYKLGEGIKETGKFIGEMAVINELTGGMGMAGKVPNYVSAPLIETGRAVISPSSFMKADEKYVQKYYENEAEIKNINNSLKINDNKINNLSKKNTLSEIEQKELEKLQTKRELLQEQKDELVNYTDSYIYGATENIKERFSERFIGGAVDKAGDFLPAVGSYLGAKNNKILQSIGKGADNVDNVITKSSDFIKNNKLSKTLEKGRKYVDNKLFESNKLGKLSKSLANHTGSAKIMHSLPAEMIEEIAVQLTPTYQENYSKQLDELRNFSTDREGNKVDSIFDSQAFDFYAMVVAQTLILGGFQGGVGASTHYYNYARNTKDKKTGVGYRDQYNANQESKKESLNLYNRLDSAIDDDQLAQDIAMSTMGSIFQVNDYNGRIAELRNEKANHNDGLTQEERNKKADIMERNSFYNLAINAINNGTDSQFKKSLEKVLKKEGVSEETKKNATLGLAKLNQIQSISEQHRNKLNYSSVLDLSIRENINNETVNDLNSKIEESRKKATTQIDMFNKMNNFTSSLFNVDNILMKLETEEEQGEYNNWLARLKQEDIPEVNQYLDNVFTKEMLEKQNYEVSKQLRYELNPNNQTEIRNRELNKIKKQRLQTVTADNADETKAELVDKEIATPDVIQAVNDKAIQSTDTVVPEVIAQNEPVIDLGNEDFSIPDLKSSGAEVSDFDVQPTKTTNLSNEEKAVLNSQPGFPSPIPFNKENTGQNELVEKLSNSFKNQLNKYPTATFNGLMAAIVDKYGHEQVDKGFNFYAEAWNNVSKDKLTPVQIQENYNRIFGNIEEDDFSIGTQSQESNPVVETKAIEESLETKVERLNPITNVIEKIKNTSRKFAKIGIKAGFLGLNYNEADGKKETNSTDVNLNALHFIDPRNFNTGDEVELVFQYDYLLNPENDITVWNDIDNNPKKETIKTKDFMERLFPGKSYDELSILLQTNPQELLKNENFLKSIPIGIKNNGQFNTDNDIITGGLNDYYWMNKANLALIDDNVDEQKARIDENRRINLETRKQILTNESLIVKVAEKSSGQHNTLLKEGEDISKEFQSLFDAHKKKKDENDKESEDKNHQDEVKQKTAIGVFQNGKLNKSDGTLITVNGKEVLPDNIINYDNFLQNLADSNRKLDGTIAYLAQSGTNSKGDPLYIIHNVINNHEAKKDAFKTQMEILFQISKYRKILDGTEKNYTSAELEKAEKIRDNIKNKFGINISNANVVNELFSFYPEKSESSNAGENKYRQDYKPRTASLEKAKTGIPNLMKYNSVNEFEADFIKGNIESVTYDDIVYNNMHTNFIYTPVTNTKGETIWTSEVQPVITYTTNHIQDIKQEDNVDVNKEKEILKKQIEVRTNILQVLEGEEDKKEIKEEIDNLKEKLVELEKQSTTSNQSEIEAKKADIEKRRQEEIAKIIQSIFPNTQLNEIVYHGTRTQDKFDTFDENKIGELDSGFFGRGFYFSPDKSYAEGYSKQYNGYTITAILNLQNPLETDANKANTNISLEDNDGAIVRVGENLNPELNITEYDANEIGEVVVKNSNQIHILSEKELGSIEKINAKYDAELKALGQQPTSNQSEIEEVKEFTDTDIAQVVENLVYTALGNMDMTQSVNKQNIYNAIVKEYNNLIEKFKTEGKNQEAQFIQDKKDIILGSGNYDNSVREIIDVLLKLDTNEEISEADINGENVKDVNKESYEQVMSLSTKVKILLSGIKASNTNNNENFGGLDTLMSLGDAIYSLQNLMSEVENNTLEDLKKLINAKIALNKNEFSFYNQLLERLENIEKIDSSILNQILYNLYQPKVKMSFVIFKQNQDGSYKMEVMDANSKNPLFVKRAMWNESFKNSPLIDKYNEGFFKLNQEGLKNYESLFEELQKNPSIESLDKYLKFIGIKLNSKLLEDTFNEGAVNNKLYNELLFNTKGVINNINNNVNKFKQVEILNSKINELNQKNYNNIINQIFNKQKFLTDKKLIEEIEKVISIEPGIVKPLELAFSGNVIEDNSIQKAITPLTFDNSIINDLIHADNSLSFIPGNMMYLGGKMINIFEQPKEITNTLKELKSNNSNRLNDLLSSQITQDNFVLNLIKENPELKQYIDVIMTSLEALKEQGTASSDKTSITKLSSKDAFVTLFNMFANSEGEFKNEKLNDLGMQLRKGMIAFPTISDSSQLPLFKTILLDIQKSNVLNNNLDEDTMNLMINHLIKGDLLRAGAFIQNGTTTNIKGYDAGAIHITGMPSMNTVAVDFEYTNSKGELIKTKRTLIEVFRNNPEYHTPEGVSKFIEKYKEDIINEMNRNIQHEVNQFISEDGTDGFFIKNDIYKYDKLSFIDGTYLSTKKDVKGLEQARLIAFDYVINNFIQQKEIQTVFAGDVANYFKDNMVKDMINGRSVTTTENIIDYYYKNDKARINEMIAKKQIDEMLNLFPQLKYSTDYITYDIAHEEQYQEVMIPAAQMKMKKVFEDVSNNLSKRLKEVLSPGNQFPNSKGNRIYKQIMLQDVENSSEVLDYLIKLNHPEKYDAVISDVKKFKLLDNIYENNRNALQKAEHEKLFKKLKEELPKIAGFLKTASTDAQEYVSWKDNLNQLLDQGRLMEDEYQHLTEKFNQQEKDLDELGYIKEENKLTDKENRMAMMQPSKPLYSGQHFVDFGDLKAQRYVYIKSSSFPITPEMASMFPKLNYLRKAINKLQAGSENTTVRISYDSANKVGAVKNAMTISDLFKDELDMNKVNASTIELDRRNFYIQQDKPFEGNDYGDKGKDMMKTRATQFEKIILGDGINKIKEKIFPNMFDSELLIEAGIELSEDNKISGLDLDKLYKLFYEKEQKTVRDKLFRELGITNYKDIASKDWKVVENLVGLVNKRLSNKQDKRFLDLVYTVSDKGHEGIKYTAKEIEEKELTKLTAEPKVPMFMTPNSRKFESVFGSITNNNSVNLKLPGGASPVASQQNFDFKGFDEFDLDKLKKQGLVTTPNFDPKVGLKATRNEAGELQYAQVFLPNRLRVYNAETGKNELVNLKDFTNEQGQIDFDKIPKDLLSMFSFRIPTSSHQSGVVIEVVGFLPDNAGDLMIVPKDHTVQIGEDYDIDTRYFYNYHYIKTADGKLKKLEYSDIPNLDKSLTELKEELEQYKKQLFEDYYNINTSVDKPLGNFKFVKNNHWRNNRETLLEIAILQDSLDNYNEDKVLHAIFQEQYDFEPIASKEEMQNKIDELFSKLIPKGIVSQRSKDLKSEYYDILKQLKEAYNNEKSGVKDAFRKYGGALEVENDRKRVLENNIISIYKSVYSSSDRKVQDLINKTLSTDFAEGTASYMNNKLSNNQDNLFNIYSASTQANIMMLGADGKTGIGVHSNFVTQNSLLQQFANIDSNNNSDVKFIKYYDNETGEPVFYNIKLGTMTFDGHLGKVFSNNGFRISESAMESQNSATDNQKLQIMGRRNENSETINVFAILQASGLDNEGVIVDDKNLSYASMFINQPIIREYVELLKKSKSLTKQNEKDALQIIKNKYFEQVSNESWAKNKNGKPIKGKFNNKKLEELGKGLTSQKLADGLQSVEFDVETQLYVLDVFKQLEKPAREYNRLQKFINIENGGVGKSYFDTIELMDEMISIVSGNIDITRSEEMIGDLKTIKNEDAETIKKLESEGYIFVKEFNGGKAYIKPSTHYGHKIVNSIANSYNLWQSIFPYESKVINDQIETILTNSPDLSKDAVRELKYKIISELKDYILSDNKTLFGRNSKNEAKKLFFDTPNNTSLSKYLLELKGNRSFDYIFKLPFFKHLEFNMGTDEFPSLLKYNSNDITDISILNVYNTLNRLVNSDKQLLPKDGKNYTEADLMKDLLMYSMLGSQENGAIGFRQLLPVELFDKYNVPLTIRNKTGNEGEIVQSVIYNGMVKSMESLLGSNVDEYGSIINETNYPVSYVKALVSKINYSLNERYNTIDKQYAESNDNGDITFNDYSGEKAHSNFVEQFMQHNSESLRTIEYDTEVIPGEPLNNFMSIIKNNGFNIQDFDNGFMIEFNSNNYDEDFITIETKNGQKLLYKRISDNRFKQIPKLGTFGMNEYNSNSVIEESLIAKNNPKSLFQHDLNMNKTDVTEIMSIEKLQEMINGFINNNGPYKDLLKMLIPHVDFKNTKIIIDANIVGLAEYRPDTNTIAVGTKLLSKQNLTKKDYQKVIVEEILHHITWTTMNKYVKFDKTNPIDVNGKLNYEFAPNTPAAIRTLVMVYQQGLDVIIKEQGLKTVLKKIKDYSDTIEEGSSNSLRYDNENELDIYRVTNIHEFIAGIFIKDSNFAKKMGETQYLNSDKSILEKFVELLGRVFDSILPGAKKDSISAQTLQSLLEFLQGESGIKTEIKPYYESTYNNETNNKIMNTAQDLLNESLSENSLDENVSNETTNIYAGTGQNKELSNFAIRPFTVNVETPSGEKQYTFKSVEQGFHFYKAVVANNPQVGKQILATTNGGQLKKLTQRNNLPMTSEQIKEWDDTAKSIMLNLMYDSYVQNPEAILKLLNTGNSKITHVGPYKEDRWTKDFPEVVMTVRDMLREEGFETNTLNISNEILQPSEFTSYSGAAIGSDKEWHKVGKEFGIGKQIDYTPKSYDELNQIDKDAIETSYKKVVALLGRREMSLTNPDSKKVYAAKLVRRDYMQAKRGDAIFAIVNGFDTNGYPKGGTAYAVASGIMLNKPTYVFNQLTNEWLVTEKDADGSFKGSWTTIDTPILTKNFTGIGTRELEENGKKAIRDVYEKTFNNNQQNLPSPIFNNEIKTGVEELFNDNFELANIGTPQQYSQYLDTIFPDSKVKDIVYRSGNIDKEEFENSEHTPTDYMDLGSGLYLSPNKQIAEQYGINPRAVIVNIKNPKDISLAQEERAEFGKKEGEYGIPKLDSSGKFDGIVDLSQEFNKTYELVVFEPEQIHILGNKQDIEGFKRFVNNGQTTNNLPSLEQKINKNKC